MGVVGRSIKKFVNGVVKIWKKLDPLTFKILKKLGLRGKHITHTYLVVQPLHSGYMPDPIKTYIAQAIAAGVAVPTYLQDALQQGAGVNLMRYYHYCRIRIKTYNFKSSTSILTGGSPISKAELKEIVQQFIPAATNYPYIISDMSVEPTPLGAYWAYVNKYKLRLENLRLRAGVSGLDINKHKGIAEDLQETHITIGSEKIHVLKTGEIFWEENGKTVSKPMYVGATDLPNFVQDNKFFYFYDANVVEAFGKSYAYLLLLVPRVTESTLDSETFTDYTGTEPDKILNEEVVIVSDFGSELVYKKYVKEIVTTAQGRKIRTYTQTFTADTSNLDNLELLYGNSTESFPEGFYDKFKELSTNDETEANETEVFKFFPAMPLKRKDKLTLTFKDGDPYDGAYDPKKHEEQLQSQVDRAKALGQFFPNDPNAQAIVQAAQKEADKVKTKNNQNDDSELQRPPRNRNTTPKGYTKPRKVNQRLRRKIKSGVTSAEYRKFSYAAKLLGENYESLVGQLIHSEKEKDSPEVHHSYILPSVTLNSKVQEVKQYWFKFFDRVYYKLHNNTPVTVNINLSEPVLKQVGTSWFNQLYPNGTNEDVEIEVTLKQSRKYNMIKPNTITINAVTDKNKTDTILFTLSYVGITRFKTIGKLKQSKKRRLRNYYDVRMGSTLGDDVLIMPVRINKQGSRITTTATGLGYYQLPDSNNFRFITEKLPSPADDFQYLKEKDFEDTLSDPDVRAWTCFCKQVGNNEIEVIAVQGLQLYSIVHDKGVAMSAHEYMLNYKELESQGYYNMFTMPVCYNTLRASGLVNNTKFAARSVQRLDYSTKDEYVPWYARSAFKVVITLVQIILFIVTIWSGGWGATLVEVAKQGAMAVAKEILIRLAISIAINLAIQAVAKALGKIFGAEFAAILGAIAAIVMTAYGISDASGISLPYASQVFMMAPAIISGSMASLSSMQANVQSMIEKEKAAYEKAMKDLDEGKEYFEAFVNSEIDPQAFVSVLNTRIELMDEFIIRTLETNMNQFADLDFLSDSLDNSLAINYMPSRELNWSGVPTESSVPTDWESNIPQEMRS